MRHTTAMVVLSLLLLAGTELSLAEANVVLYCGPNGGRRVRLAGAPGGTLLDVAYSPKAHRIYTLRGIRDQYQLNTWNKSGAPLAATGLPYGYQPVSPLHFDGDRLAVVLLRGTQFFNGSFDCQRSNHVELRRIDDIMEYDHRREPKLGSAVRELMAELMLFPSASGTVSRLGGSTAFGHPGDPYRRLQRYRVLIQDLGQDRIAWSDNLGVISLVSPTLGSATIATRVGQSDYRVRSVTQELRRSLFRATSAGASFQLVSMVASDQTVAFGIGVYDRPDAEPPQADRYVVVWMLRKAGEWRVMKIRNGLLARKLRV